MSPYLLECRVRDLVMKSNGDKVTSVQGLHEMHAMKIVYDFLCNLFALKVSELCTICSEAACCFCRACNAQKSSQNACPRPHAVRFLSIDCLASSNATSNKYVDGLG